MTTTKYRILINVQPDSHYGIPGRGRGFDPNGTDLVVETFTGTIHHDHDDLALCEDVFVIHNRDDRPDGQVGPSLSCGDVVELSEASDEAHDRRNCRWYVVESFGFKALPQQPPEASDTTWRTIQDAAREATGGFRHPAPGYPLEVSA